MRNGSGPPPPGTQAPAPRPFLLRLWLGLSGLCPGLLRRLARRAHVKQGGDDVRLRERFGQPSLPRPDGPLIWVHAASVGEIVSVVAFVRALQERTQSQVLVTTSTQGGAETTAKRLPEALHQFLPVDTESAVEGFLTHWSPDAALFVEGDLWPRLVLALMRRGTPMALLNARASNSRARFPRLYAALLAPMRLVTAQSDEIASSLVGLGLDPDRVISPGNLKAEVDLPPGDAALRASVTQVAQDRPVWAAVSTHPGEDEIILDAHAALPDQPLLVLVPRHPNRGDAIATLLQDRALPFTRHSSGETPAPDTKVHLVDSFGDTGAVYGAVPVALVGGSLLPGPGGHTPYEPAALNTAILHGPHVENFAAAYQALQATGGAREVADANALTQALTDLFANAGTLAAMQAGATREYDRHGGAVARTLDLVMNFLPKGPK